MAKLKLVVLTGAGISAESGINTFRDTNGLWEGYSIYDVATPEAWIKNPALVQSFYNQRRKQVINAEPNEAHFLLAKLQNYYDVKIITQNVDDLHERAGSECVLHLHGEIRKAQSSINPELIYKVDGDEIKMGELCSLGSQLRPHIVWFGEAVPAIEKASVLCAEADIFVVIGTSLVVYPAAGLLDFVLKNVDKYIIDPKIPKLRNDKNIFELPYIASEGVSKLYDILMKQYL